MKIIKTSPVLQSVAKSGKAKFWQLFAIEDGGKYSYQKTWWQDGSKKQSSTPSEVKGKNIGRANETSAKSQLISEFDAIVQKRRDKGYSEDGSADHVPTKPMLAHKWKEKKHKVEFPCFVQPKLDGFRMLKEGNGSVAWTRGGKEHVRECVEHLMWNTGDSMVDGELILPHMPALQETSRAAKKFRPGVSDTLMYHVYDVVMEDVPFAVRYDFLKEFVKNAPWNVSLVETIEVKDESELFAAHVHFTSQGFEGTIIRSGTDGYEIGHRSSSLLKMKDFQDAEFLIVGAKDGKGSFKGKIVFVCETEDGSETFDCVPEGTMEYRAELYRNRKKYIGQYLTVRYQTLSEKGKPIFPIGVDIREEGEF